MFKRKLLWVALLGCFVYGIALHAGELNFEASETTIVIAENAPASVKFAATELSHFLAQSTGKKYRVQSDMEFVNKKGGKLILVGRSKLTGKLDLPTKFSPDSFLIKAFPANTLVLIGDDMNIGRAGYLPFNYISARKGSLYAVYTLLEKYLGARWFWPGKSGEIVPKCTTLKVPDNLNYSSKPAFIWRHAWYYSVNKTPKVRKAIALWYVRNKMGISSGNASSFQHIWGRTLTDKYFKEHPEYYSMLKGKRQPIGKYRQVCSSNSEVINIFAKKYIAKSKPGVDNILSISPNDGNGFCECVNCKKLDHQQLYSKNQGYQGIVYSDRVYSFVNQVAEKIKQQRPELRLGLFAYTFYSDPPKTMAKLNDNVVIALTQINGRFNYANERKVARSRLAAWSKKCQQIIIRDYLGDYHYCEVVHPYTKIIAEDLKYLHNNGAVGFYWESAVDFQTNHLNYYLAARLMWDVKQSRKTILNDYYAKAYGKAAPFMRQYFELMELDFTTREQRTKIKWGAAGIPQNYRPGTLIKAVELFKQATNAVTDPAIKTRIAYDRMGLQYTILVCNFFISCQRLTDIGLVVRMKDYVQRPGGGKINKAAIVKAVKAAVEHKRQLLDFIKQSNPVNLISMLPHQDRTFKWFETIDAYEKMFASTTQSKDTVTLMAAECKFKLDPGKAGVALNWWKADFDDSKWKQIKTTTFWEKQGYPNYDGVAWYRMKQRIKANPAKEKIILRFGAVDEDCDLYVNGKFVGKHRYDAKKDPDGWKKPVEFDITKFIVPGKENSFAVKVTDSSGGGGLWKGIFLKVMQK
jgi:Domain of unknown function (DUF4838)/Glycosyl hydrolases family 2, sugar binding domain